MKRTTLVLMLLAILIVGCFALTACGADAPTETSIIAGLREMPNIVDIAAATEYNDPNGLLNKESGYIAHVYFSVDVIDQDQVFGATLIDKGTEAGGSIEVYKTKNDAKKRDEYLSTFDGTVFTSGSHKVVGTCVVRTSSLLTASLQNILENNIEKMLKKSTEPYVSMDMYLYSVAKEVAEKDNLSQYEVAIKLVEYGYPLEKSATIAENCGASFSDIAKKLAEGYEDYYATVSPLMIAELLEERLFDVENISYAIQNADIDWETCATIHAQSYADQVESENGYLTPIDVLVYLCWEKGYVYDWEDWIFDKAEYMYIALDNMDVNWNQKAVEYIEYVEYDSNYAIKNDYISELLDMEFTQEQAEYAVAHCDIDWNQHAYLSLQYYVEEKCTTAPTKSECINILKKWGFTQSECDYALSQFTCKEIPSLGHKYQSTIVPPSCTTQGYTKHICSGCGNSYNDTYVDALGHTEGSVVVENNVEPSCIVDGSYDNVVYCTVCDAELSRETKTIEATGHSHGTVVTKPTCTKRGYTTHTCHCGDSYIDTYVNALGHDEIKHDAQAPTCAEVGWDAYVTCSRCDYSTYVGIYDIHNFQQSDTCEGCGQNIADVAVDSFDMSATVDDNVMGYVISRPDGNYDAYIKGTGDMKDYYSVDSSPFKNYSKKLADAYIAYGMTSIGFFAFVDCANLTRIVIPDSVTSISGSAFVSCISLARITIPDSVTSIGNAAFEYCFGLTDVTFGKNSQLKTIGNYAFYGCDITSIDIPASVTSIGYNAFLVCENLENVIFEDSNGWYVTETQNATSGTNLTLTNTSTNAKYLKYTYNDYYWYKKTIEHSYTSVVTDPTCTEQGFTTHTCADCGDIYVDTYVDALGHTEGAVVVENKVDATCTTNGSYDNVVYCFVCDTELSRETETIEAGHSYSAVVTPPTCTEQGYTNYTCANCEDSYADTYIDALGHTWGDWYETTAPTFTESGEERRDCKNCDDYETNELPAFGISGAWGDLTWTLNKNTGELVISGTGEMDAFAFTNNPTDAWRNYSGIIKLATIENGVTNIGTNAFYYCSGLTRITIPNSVTKIGGSAFYGCTNLTSIDIPNSVTNIGSYAFQGCSSLTSIDIPYGVTNIGESAFYGCTNLTSIDIPNSVTNIGSYAFQGCSSLESINIPEGVTNIGESAFSRCSNLTIIEIPDSVTTIGEYAFYDCKSLTSITIPDSVTAIGDYAFFYCNGLTDVYFTGTEEQWNKIRISSSNAALTNANITFNYHISHSYSAVVTPPTCAEQGYTTHTCHCGDSYIDTYVKATGHSHSAVVTEPTCTEQGYTTHTCHCGDSYVDTYVDAYGVHNFQQSDTCENCRQNIVDVAVASFDMSATDDDNVKGYIVPCLDGKFYAYIKGAGAMKDYEVSDAQFDDSSHNEIYSMKIVNVYIGNNITTIGSCAFYRCFGLTSVIFGDTNQLISIGDYAFNYCMSLENITIPEGVTSVGEWAVSQCEKLVRIDIPSSVITIGNSAFYNCTSLESVTFGEDSQLTSIGQEVFAAGSFTSIVIPDSVTTIGDSAFFSCYGLTSIDIPSSVITIGNSAFSNCTSLEIVTFGEDSQLTSIGQETFAYCRSLRNISIPDSITSIGYKAFCYCDSLTSVTFGKKSQLTNIGQSAFIRCSSLKSITIPVSVTSISYYAFGYCSSLTSVTFEDTTNWYVGNEEVDVTNTSTNATYLVDTYDNYYWHKK